MNAGMLIVSTCLSLAFLALVFIPLEKAFPARRQKTLRPGWATDLAFFAGQYFLWSGLIEQIPRSYLGQLLNPFYRRKMPRSHRRMAEDLRANLRHGSAPLRRVDEHSVSLLP